MAVDWEFYVYRFGRPRPGRTDGRADGARRRTDGRTEGGRADGRRADDFERQYNDFHRFSQKTSKNTVFFCRFASGGSASTDFYCKNEKRVQKRCKIDWFFDVSKQAIAQVPIFTPKMKKFGRGRRASGSTGSTGNATRSVVHNPWNTRARGQDDGSSKQTPSNNLLPEPQTKRSSKVDAWPLHAHFNVGQCSEGSDLFPLK